MVAILVLFTIIAFLSIDYIAQQRAARNWAGAEGRPAGLAPVIPLPLAQREVDELSRTPVGLFWSPGHTWAQLEPSGTLRVGGGKLPLHALGSPDTVEIAEAGAQLTAGQPIATLRRGERELRLEMPFEGEVESVNERVLGAPAGLPALPLEESWLCRVRPRDLAGALRHLRVGSEASAWMLEELRRLREHLGGLASTRLVPAPTLQDGGLPVSSGSRRCRPNPTKPSSVERSAF